MIGTVIEHYKIVSCLGEGGMGIVYKAFDLKLERYIAIKILSSHAVNNPQFIERFKREAKNQAKLTHPNIVPVYGITEENRLFGIVMEYVEGETLERMISRKGRLNIVDSLKIIQQVLSGVSYAHSKGFVHRDLKPSNIIINTDGVAKIMDFGISKSLNESKAITQAGMKIGTLLYMSPEQINAHEPTNQSDIYSIGITLYEMLCGKTPFEFETDYEVMEGHLKKNPPRLSSAYKDIPPETDKIISKAMQKSLDKRYIDCEEFLGDTELLLEDISLPAGQKKTRPRKGKTKKAHKPKPDDARVPLFMRIRFYLLTFIFLCIFGGLFYFVFTTVSDFWKSGQNPSKEISRESDGYQSNPAYLMRTSWKSLNSPVSQGLNAVVFLNDSIGISCGNAGTLIRTTDGGSDWKSIGDSTDINYYDICFVSANTGFIAGGDGTILVSNDSGAHWKKLPEAVNKSLFKIFFLNDGTTGFIVGGEGTILKTDDAGRQWVPVPSNTNELLYSVSFGSPSKGIAVGWKGTILTTTDKGNTWKKSEKINDNYLRDIYFINERTAVIAGGGGQILRTEDAGEDWNVISSNTISGLSSVYFIDNMNGMILGSKGEILVTKDGGKSWQISPSGGYAALKGITSTPSKKVFIVGRNGVILTD